MRKSSIMMLVGAVFLGLVAVIIARVALAPTSSASAAAPATIQVVAANIALSFGDKVGNENLKLVELPVGSVPEGAFRTIADTVADGSRVAQRAVALNEVLVPTAISGTGSRLSTMGTIGPSMRAISVTLSEATGVGGLVAPGDHVDVYITRTPPDKAPHYDVVVVPAPAMAPAAGSSAMTALVADARDSDGRVVDRGGGKVALPMMVRTASVEGVAPAPVTDLLVQDVRVLAIGQNTNVSSEKPELVKSATLEVTPAQVAKLTLGQSVGTLTLALRPLADKDRTAVASLRVEDLHDGPAIRRVAAAVPRQRRARTVRRTAPAPSVEIVRGGKETLSTSYIVSGGN